MKENVTTTPYINHFRLYYFCNKYSIPITYTYLYYIYNHYNKILQLLLVYVYFDFNVCINKIDKININIDGIYVLYLL